MLLLAGCCCLPGASAANTSVAARECRAQWGEREACRAAPGAQMNPRPQRRIAPERLLLCLLAISRQATQPASAKYSGDHSQRKLQAAGPSAMLPHCENCIFNSDSPQYHMCDLEECYEQLCAGFDCSFGCIDDDMQCDSHVAETSYSEWNERGMHDSCGCRETCSSGAGVCHDCDTLEWAPCNTCERVPCRADGDEMDGMAAAVLGILVVVCVVSCVALGGGMYCCIQQKSKALGGRPSSTAWIASLIICIIGGPLCMWIPFIIDSCYDRRPAQTAVIIQQAPQNFVMAQQPVMAQAQAQPVMAQAQPAMMAQAQPVMAQAQPVMAQAQPMSKTQTQGP